MNERDLVEALWSLWALCHYLGARHRTSRVVGPFAGMLRDLKRYMEGRI